uniref:Recep_L_domain domain-containing protein n=1 Tax=Rhabditophanes sp. KR3021 TaxID=114890 RepID=A0AC35TMZ4_9BILA
MNLFILAFLFPIFSIGRCFQDCNIEGPVINISENPPHVRYTFDVLQFIKYDFEKDICKSFNDIAYFSLNHTEIYINSPPAIYTMKKYHANYRGACVPVEAKYLLRNLWVIIPDKIENKDDAQYDEISKELFELKLFMQSMSESTMHSFTLKSYDPKNKGKLHPIWGEEHTKLFEHEIHGVVLRYCKQFNATNIIRSRKIGDTCYEDIPVIIGQRTAFSKDGLNLLNNSRIVHCKSFFYENSDTIIEVICLSINGILGTFFAILLYCFIRKRYAKISTAEDRHILLIN